MEFKTTCQLCGAEYDNYMRTFYVDDYGIKTRVCLNCRKKYCQDKYVYTNHIPNFCDGGDVISVIFKTEEELLNHILSSTGEGYICCMDSNGAIIDVLKSRKFWWVRGYSNLKAWKLPNWKDKVRELYGGNVT